MNAVDTDVLIYRRPGHAKMVARYVGVFRKMFPAMPTPRVADQAFEPCGGHLLHWDSLLLGACKASLGRRCIPEIWGARRLAMDRVVNPFISTRLALARS